jgi:hypothetical protein
VELFVAFIAVELLLFVAVTRRLRALRRCHEDLAAALTLIRRGEVVAARGIVKRWAAMPTERPVIIDGQPRPPTRIQ